jgi:hypothetical protein
MSTVANRPAFARAGSEDRRSGSLPDGDDYIAEQDGLTKREYFAAAAMQGLLACPSQELPMWPQFAASAVSCADALMAALNDETPGSPVADPVAIAAIRLLNELDGWSQEALDQAGGVTNTKALQQAMDRLSKAVNDKAGVR